MEYNHYKSQKITFIGHIFFETIVYHFNDSNLLSVYDWSTIIPSYKWFVYFNNLRLNSLVLPHRYDD